MQVGDLVKHRSDGCFGTVVEVRRRKLTGQIGGLAKVYWAERGVEVLHPIGQLEIIEKK